MESPIGVWKTMKRQLLLDVAPWFEVWQETVRLPDGRTVPDFYKLAMSDVCCIVALCQDRKIIVLRQYKHGAGDIVFNLPAGFLESNESAMEGAKRELIEETGYTSDTWIDLGSYVRDANRGCGAIHIFLALNVRQIVEPDSGDLEDYQIHFYEIDDLLSDIFDSDTKIMSVTLAILLAKQYLKQHGGVI